jgi:8-oxo-dGTP pyrophosphatase MutT (NUDIX family)
MTAEPTQALATGPLGMRLLGFERLPEETPPTGHELTYVLVALWQRDLVLMVRERVRDCWELPGGGIDPGETPRQAAVRELREESGQQLPAADLRFEGFARTALPNRQTRYGALYTAEAAEPQAVTFTANDEIAAVHWWNRTEPLPGGRLQTVDSYLIDLIRPAGGPPTAA